LDRAKKMGRTEPQSMGATALVPEPVPGPPVPEVVGDWREKLHAALMELGLTFTADAVEHSEITEKGALLELSVPKEFSLSMKPEEISRAVQKITQRPYKIKVTLTNDAPNESRLPSAKSRTAGEPDEVDKRALSNPEVQRFREVFGGEVRAVRDLKKVD